MNIARYVTFFIIAFVLQLVLFLGIKKDSDVTLLDMVVMSLILAVLSFLLDKFQSRRKQA
ncbi:hypothetical protein CHCC14819_0486 [Bacillus licheniformis]|uniref:hypothetical protein n=1 Tax=Bacillus licheniformis TaxID=1402 RepID=UPI0011A6238F|nr:hypothetical protein [Bacillus licheniformis]TWM32290.1 hypothetical protein CHCC14819_0486 [Bacillus licheniformis]